MHNIKSDFISLKTRYRPLKSLKNFKSYYNLNKTRAETVIICFICSLFLGL